MRATVLSWLFAAAAAFAPPSLTERPAHPIPAHRTWGRVRLRNGNGGADSPSFPVPSWFSKGRVRPGSMKEAILTKGVDSLYGEESRKYRRTIYTQDDWTRHRSPDRLIKNLRGTFTSGVVRSLVFELGLVVAVAALVVLWNCSVGGYADFSNAAHPALFQGMEHLTLQLPALPFTLSSPPLGLLLVFRTNSSYQRWLEARMTWARVTASLHNVSRQAAVWLDPSVAEDERERVLKGLGVSAWAFAASLRWTLAPHEERELIAQDLRRALGAADADALLRAPCPPQRALRALSAHIVALPMDERRRVVMDRTPLLLGELAAVCERIFSSPVPLVYTRHTSRFLGCWALLLPLCLWPSFGASWNHVLTVPASALLALFLFGIEELAVQLEEPFSILPLEHLCSKVEKVAEDMRT